MDEDEKNKLHLVSEFYTPGKSYGFNNAFGLLFSPIPDDDSFCLPTRFAVLIGPKMLEVNLKVKFCYIDISDKQRKP